MDGALLANPTILGGSGAVYSRQTHHLDRLLQHQGEPMIRSILCAVDRSVSSLQAFDYAMALARWQGARLTLLEVIEAPALPNVSRAPKVDRVPTETREALEGDLKLVLASRGTSDVKAEIFMREGNVVQEILAQAKASRSDLVVIGTHGRGGVQSLVLGSVAEKVLRLATCPVLTVRRGVSPPRRRRPPFETILCPTDFSVAANKAVAYAKRLAKEADAKLILMNALDWPFGDAVTSGPVVELRKGIESNARETLARLLPRAGSDGPRTQAVVTSGKAGAEIVMLARARSVDLIVMGVSGSGAWDEALLGSTTHHVIRRGAWPVLTVRAVKR